MFKDDSETPLRLDCFGAGSTISGNWDDIYLVFSSGTKEVSVLDLQSMKVLGSPLKVNDPNYLTSSEARELVSNTVGNHLGWTYTDFDLYSEGIKFINRKSYIPKETKK